MGKKTKEEKLKIVDELAVALAPYLWNRSWGFGLNMYFDDVHVDFREMNSYIYSETQAEDESVVLGGLEKACIEYGEFEDERYQTYKEVLALDPDIEMFVICEQEIYEEIYLYLWEGEPSGKGMVERIEGVLEKHNMILNLQDYSIVIYSDDR